MWRVLNALDKGVMMFNGSFAGHLWAGSRVDLILAAIFHHVNPAPTLPRRTYLDVAAAFPEAISNTMMLDACFGWAGVCVEADASKQPALHARRSCVVAETCVHERDGIEVSFVTDTDPQKGAEGATHGFIKEGLAGLKGLTSIKSTGKESHVETLTCRTLNTIARETGLVAPNSRMVGRSGYLHVDVMSLDIEGAEHFALHGVDWTTLTIGVIVMEINDQHRVDAQTGVLPESGVIAAQALARGGYVPVLAVFPYRKGIPIADCLGMAIGYTPMDIFNHSRWTTPLARYRAADVFFMVKGSDVYEAALTYISSAGCDTSDKLDPTPRPKRKERSKL